MNTVRKIAQSCQIWIVLPLAGSLTTASNVLTDSRVTAGESRWVVRILSHHPDSVVPRRIYSASCAYNGQTKVFASLTTKTTTSDATQGMIVSANVDAAGNVSGFSQQVFSSCKEMNGIAATSNCSTVVAMCRRPAGSTGASRDLVAGLPATATGNDWRTWLTAESTDDQMWLYEWKGNPATPTGTGSTFQSFVVSKAIGGGWEYGHQNIVISNTHYGVSMKSTTRKDGVGTQHQGDSFVAVNRLTPAIDTARGWKWACATGHTLANRATVSAAGKFAALCTTDWNGKPGAEGNGAIWMRVEDRSATMAHTIYNSRNYPLVFNGGATSILPLADGGFIGVLVGSDNPKSPEPTKIGLVRFNSDGGLQSFRWVAADGAHWLSYAQLAPLGNDANGAPRYLLGWARMMSTATSTLESVKPDQTQRLATKCFVQEIDQYGEPRTSAREVVHGWGEQDQMFSLGNGMAGWVYTPDPRYRLPLPTPNSPTLQWTIYKSSATLQKSALPATRRQFPFNDRLRPRE